MSKSARKTRWYLAACACLLLLAAALRFYGLPNDELSYDEAVAVSNSQGTLAETIHNTRYANSSPILYPLALWAVQQVERSPASFRALPAAASVATVAVLLLLLPRVGFSRRAALLSALLLTLSVPAIEHAQGVREYSIDALWAALLTAALLGYSQTGRKAPLGAALFLAPLIQYGLVFFGAAVIAVALFIPPPTRAWPNPAGGGGRRFGFLSGWARGRIGLLYPAAGFAAGCAVSWWATYRFHREGETFGGAGYLKQHYYQGPYDDAAALGEFIYEKTLNFLQYHLPQAEALLALTASALLLGGAAAAWRRFSSRRGAAAGVNPPDSDISGRRRRTANRAIVLLFCCSMAAAIAVGLLRIYPFGGIRQTVYLAPVIFLILGLALHRAGGGLAALARWRWAPAGALAGFAGLIAFAGFADIQQRHPHSVSRSYEPVVAELRKRALFNEVAFIPWRYTPSLHFYLGSGLDNRHFSPWPCLWLSTEDEDPECFRKVLDAVDYAPRILLVHSNDADYAQDIPQRIQEWRAGAAVERIALNDRFALYVVTNFDQGAQQQLAYGEPSVRSDFDLHLFGGQVYYVKEPCRPADVEPPFLLHIVPDQAGDLPPQFQDYGFENRDFQWEGTKIDGRCLDSARLPDYPIAKIRTGQYRTGQDDLWQGDLWRETLPGPGRELRPPAGELLARGVFDLYRDGRELHYAKEPCRRADLDPMFFLHIVPADSDDLPPEGREGGFHGLDFRWNRERLGERCIATERLPDYPIARIHTGQYISGQGELWREEIAVSAAPPP